jgi:hypothetical protein
MVRRRANAQGIETVVASPDVVIEKIPLVVSAVYAYADQPAGAVGIDPMNGPPTWPRLFVTMLVSSLSVAGATVMCAA